MSYKPDEAILISYLYGELSAEEARKVEKYLASHPEAKMELEGIAEAQKFLGKLQDQEVAEPTFAFGDSETLIVTKGNWLNSFAKATLAIAASISLLLMVGYMTQTSINIGGEGLNISFAGEQSAAVDSGVNEQVLKDWMKETLADNNKHILTKLGELEANVGNQSHQLASVESKYSAGGDVDQELLDAYVEQLNRENRDIIFNLLEASGRSQKDYMDAIMTDFANYLEAQRQSDLRFIQNNMLRLTASPDLEELEEYRTSE